MRLSSVSSLNQIVIKIASSIHGIDNFHRFSNLQKQLKCDRLMVQK
ncbi:hypothetical protein H1P_3210001 [Hyella patelloides LEGE 07179]|uniref:Uncharacterized protein n=1 Tax=Hyella patelloides LEGE 07179 TaxID=945734 RepID=A0A563VV24_9CYAN|nr:hypothetical protein [Hyella patelloides]VEP15289.1 hypothetical protein H1P_3210001 [Hyella patelloides LEGE 07179]